MKRLDERFQDYAKALDRLKRGFPGTTNSNYNRWYFTKI